MTSSGHDRLPQQRRPCCIQEDQPRIDLQRARFSHVASSGKLWENSKLGNGTTGTSHLTAWRWVTLSRRTYGQYLLWAVTHCNQITKFSRVWFGHRATRTARRAARNTGSGRILLPLSAVDAIAPARSWSHLPGGMDIVNCVTYLNRTISAVSAPPPPDETS